MKRYVAFLRAVSPVNAKMPALKRAFEGAGFGEVFSAYARTPRGPVFMVLIEKTLGRNVTTRTWETVMKVAT